MYGVWGGTASEWVRRVGALGLDAVGFRLSLDTG